MRVNPKTGESEIQADMELDKVSYPSLQELSRRNVPSNQSLPPSPSPIGCITSRRSRMTQKPSPRVLTLSCPPSPT
jgi:hypothetical protein